MRIYKVTIEGRANSVFAYSNSTVTVMVKANYSLEACQRVVSEFSRVMINIKVIECKEVAV